MAVTVNIHPLRLKDRSWFELECNGITVVGRTPQKALSEWRVANQFWNRGDSQEYALPFAPEESEVA